MSLAAIREQIANRLADVSAAGEKWRAMPQEPPQRLPCVVTRWSTTPVRERYGVFPNAISRVHTIDGYVLIAMRANADAEDVAAMELAEKLMNEFLDDGTLNGMCSDCRIALCEPYAVQYGEAAQGTAYYGLHAQFTIEETTA